jgi:hypothetical protein
MNPVTTLRTWRPAEPAQDAGLAERLAEPDTVLLLVVGEGADSDQAERRCRDLADEPGFEEVRVVRLRDRAQLTRAQRASWLSGDRPMSIVDSTRRVAVPLARADAVDLFVALAAVA